MKTIGGRKRVSGLRDRLIFRSASGISPRAALQFEVRKFLEQHPENIPRLYSKKV